ncbi:MAG: hypothetical protein ACR2IF_04030 [Terriglobales bacterium]
MSIADCRLKLTVAIAALILCCAALAQAPPKAQPTPPKPDVVPQAPNPPASESKPQARPQPKPDHKMTPAEAKELLASVDEILAFDSRDTRLKIKHPIKRQLASRDQVQKFVEERMKDDEDAQRLQRSEAVLKKFGLVPRDFDLRSFLVELLREQVAGYYDSKTKTVYLLDWLEPETQLPVMAHELTHALQDQNVGLEKWVKRGTSEKTPADEVRGDEEIAARHAIIEGQAMAVMIDYLLAPMGGSVTKSPMVTKAIQESMMTGTGSPVFDRAPLFLKRVLLFPYSYGLDFERELLEKKGLEAAYAGVLKKPPQNTRQVMEPATYLADEKLVDVPMPDFGKLLGSEWEKYDVGSIGEFDVALMAEIYANADTAKKMYPNWRGGWYYAAKKKGTDTIGLVFVSKWVNLDAAKTFASLYGSTVDKRYKTTGTGGGGAIGGGSPHCISGDCSNSLGASTGFVDTTDGRVYLAVSHMDADTVLAIESLPPDLALRVQDAVLTKYAAAGK